MEEEQNKNLEQAAEQATTEADQATTDAAQPQDAAGGTPAQEADASAAATGADAAATDAADELEKAEGKLRHGRAKMSAVHWFGLHAIILITVLYVLFSFFVGITTMPNADMYPRVDAGDLLLFWRLDSTHRAQDVVYFVKDGSPYVGRVVAVGGDTVEITDSETVKVNGNTLMESNIFVDTPRYEGFVDYPLTLPADTYFVLADAREGAHDSRYFGPVSKDEIKGVVVTIMRRQNL